jgi:hypothetical protein
MEEFEGGTYLIHLKYIEGQYFSISKI